MFRKKFIRLYARIQRKLKILNPFLEFIFLLLILTVAVVSIFLLLSYILHDLNESNYYEHSLVYYIFTIVIPFALLMLAYFKANKALSQSKTSYLLRIDERFSSAEIIAAREVIHRFYLDAKKSNPTSKNDKKYNELLKPMIGKSIIEASRELSQTQDFIKLLNFLDFMETMGYLHSKGDLETIEIKELFGNSVIYFYDIFKPFIIRRRVEKEDKFFYKEFQRMYVAIKQELRNR